jgi:uncharacterized damage-inducible protein DinB
MAIECFRQLAAYNKWANTRIYEVAQGLPPADYRRPTGVFFGSLHGTLNHLLLTDRIWLKRLTGIGEHPDRLDAMLFDELDDLAEARKAEDARLIAVVDGYDDRALAERVSYRTTSGTPHEQVRSDILLHLFNHQTHHRGQCHACVSIVTGKAPPTLDLLAFQRGLPARIGPTPA